MRSIPEKTLEHWSSIYLSNRFPNGALWWPAHGEDVLAELPRLAATGPGKTLALELKTTEAIGGKHVLQIDTRQLKRYLSPPVGPPLPVYYVFPLPHWTGTLTSRHGSAPFAPSAMTGVPSKWWRQRAGSPWFGNWLYVMSAKAVASALRPDWKKHNRQVNLLTLNSPFVPGSRPAWETLLTRMPAVPPMLWKPFWDDMTLWGLSAKLPQGGVCWLTISGSRGQDDLVWVLGDEERQHTWSLGELLDPQRPGVSQALTAYNVDQTGANARTEYVILHLPDR